MLKIFFRYGKFVELFPELIKIVVDDGSMAYYLACWALLDDSSTTHLFAPGDVEAFGKKILKICCQYKHIVYIDNKFGRVCAYDDPLNLRILEYHMEIDVTQLEIFSKCENCFHEQDCDHCFDTQKTPESSF
jgi:hypothetical protein